MRFIRRDRLFNAAAPHEHKANGIAFRHDVTQPGGVARSIQC